MNLSDAFRALTEIMSSSIGEDERITRHLRDTFGNIPDELQFDSGCARRTVQALINDNPGVSKLTYAVEMSEFLKQITWTLIAYARRTAIPGYSADEQKKSWLMLLMFFAKYVMEEAIRNGVVFEIDIVTMPSTDDIERTLKTFHAFKPSDN